MASERLYYDDSYTTRFTARVAATSVIAGGPAVELESTYFYPESGGQEADRGRLGASRVVDVQADEAGRVWHVLDEGVAGASGAAGGAGAAGTAGVASPESADSVAMPAVGEELAAEVDWPRRFEHMQQHTGQHILSAAFERVLDAPTVSSHLGEERNTLDVKLANATWNDVARAEEAANAIVWEAGEVLRHWADAETVKRFALRKPPQVSGRIRIVEVPGWDVSACGGTHTRRTGEIGVIKVLRWERVRDTLRFEFHCGSRAVRDHAWRIEAMAGAAKRRTMKELDLIPQLEKAAAERDELVRRVRDLTARIISGEAAERVARDSQGVAEFRDGWPREEARTFAFKCIEFGALWIAVAAGGPEPFIMIARARSGSGDVRALLPGLLERSAGKGGGSADAVQVSARDATAARTAWEWARAELPVLVNATG